MISEFTAQIQTWQERARRIDPPAGGTPSRGGLAGPAFFPEGLGLAHAGDSRFTFPTAIVVGHNFSSTAYRDDIENRFAGSEEKQVTYSNLKDILDRANVEVAGSKLTIGSCFLTNFFVGLIDSKEPSLRQSGRKRSYENEGRFLDPSQDNDNAAYIQHCAALLRDEIACIAPRDSVSRQGRITVCPGSDTAPGMLALGAAQRVYMVVDSQRRPDRRSGMCRPASAGNFVSGRRLGGRARSSLSGKDRLRAPHE